MVDKKIKKYALYGGLIALGGFALYEVLKPNASASTGQGGGSAGSSAGNTGGNVTPSQSTGQSGLLSGATPSSTAPAGGVGSGINTGTISNTPSTSYYSYAPTTNTYSSTSSSTQKTYTYSPQLSNSLTEQYNPTLTLTSSGTLGSGGFNIGSQSGGGSGENQQGGGGGGPLIAAPTFAAPNYSNAFALGGFEGTLSASAPATTPTPVQNQPSHIPLPSSAQTALKAAAAIIPSGSQAGNILSNFLKTNRLVI